MLGAGADDPDQIVARARKDHAPRFYLIDAGVGGIERTGDLVETDLAGRPGLEIAAEILTMVVGH
jgi:hypothetical protein